MSDGRHPTEGCLDTETLAAFIDGRLEPRDRAAVEAHLADCEDCYEVWMDAQQTSTEVAARVREVPTPHYRPWMILVAVAATLVMGIVIGRDWLAPNRGLIDELAAASPGRPSEGRLVGFRWDALPDRSRAGTRPEVSPEVTIAVARLKQALQKERTFATLHANAAGELVLGNLDAAIASLREALAIRIEPAALSDLSAALLARGASEERQIDFAEAFEVASKALDGKSNLAEAAFNRAVALERLEQRNQAIESWERFLRLDSTSEWAEEARRRLEVLRKTDRVLDRDAARKTLLEKQIPAWAISVAGGGTGEQLLNDAMTMAASADAGSPDKYATDVALSIRAAASQLELAKAIVDYDQGLQAAAARDYVRADEVFDRAESRLVELKTPLRYSAALGRAAALFNLHRLEEAANVIEGMASGLPGQYLRVKGRTQWLRGIILMAKGHQTPALDAYEQAVTAYTASGEVANAAFVSGLIAEGYQLVGDQTRSWQFRVRSIAVAPGGVSLLAAGLAARSQDWPQLATYFQEAAIAASRAAGDDRGIVDSLRERALSYAAAHNLPGARQALKEAALLAGIGAGPDWVRLRAELDLATARIADPAFFPEALAAADRALEFFRNAGILIRLPPAYLAKAGLLEALHKSAEARTTLSDGLAIYQEQRRRLPRGIMSASLGDMARELVDRIARLALDSGDPDTAFAVLDENRSGSGGSAPLRAPITPARIRAQIPEHVAVISFAVCDNETLIWAIGRLGSSFHRADVSKRELQELVERVVTKGDLDASSELHRVLIEPILKVLAADGVSIVIPDGPLFRLPFALLRDRSGRYLVETQAVAFAPSAAWLIQDRPFVTNGVRIRSISAFGNPAFDRSLFPKLVNLPASEREAENVVQPYEVKSIKIGKAATRAAFESSLLADDVVHFAGHALLNPIDPQSSLLALAPDGLKASLTAADVSSLRGIHSRLVVLAACQSAGGPISRSEGALGLAQAFLQSGARSVVASLTDIGDEASQQFFEIFHQYYAKTGDAIRALQEAQRRELQGADKGHRGWANVVAFSGWNSVPPG